MRLPKRDVAATILVVLAVVLAWLWAVDAAPPGLRSVRATGIVILVLGFAASASAVVPAFDELLHGSKAYLAITSVMGVVALVAGLQMLIAETGAGLAVMVVAMVALWAAATRRHMLSTGPATGARVPRPRPPSAAAH
jgi:hypothetical protein